VILLIIYHLILFVYYLLIMCNELNATMLSRIISKKILLIVEDTIDCILYMKKKVITTVLANNYNDTRTAVKVNYN